MIILVQPVVIQRAMQVKAISASLIEAEIVNLISPRSWYRFSFTWQCKDGSNQPRFITGSLAKMKSLQVTQRGQRIFSCLPRTRAAGAHG
jgi:hypothetical protein